MTSDVRVAALFVQSGGVYFDMPGVEPWDVQRDATRYAGPLPVVAHPPCARWCMLSHLVEARWPHCKRGEDGGLFESALLSVRTYGGVLEHPAWSAAFAAYGIPAPIGDGVWQRSLCGGWVAHVYQQHFGHPARKATWLYAYGVPSLPSLPSLPLPPMRISWCGNKSARDERRPLLGKAAASVTPPSFARLLVDLAASARARGAA